MNDLYFQIKNLKPRKINVSLITLPLAKMLHVEEVKWYKYKYYRYPFKLKSRTK